MARAATVWYWRGTTNTVYSTSTNWVITGGGAPDASDYPGWDNDLATNVDGDSVIFDAAVTNACAGGDFSAKGDLAAIRITSVYDKDVAASGTPLLVDMQAAGEVLVEASAAGNVYLKGGGAQGLPLVRVLDTKVAKTISLDGALGTVHALKGIVNIESTATIATALTIGYLENPLSDMTLTIEAAATIPATVDVTGGTVTNNVAVTTLRMSGGQWTNTAGAVTTLILSGGKFNWTNGAITTAQLHNGVFNGNDSATIRTLTTCYLYGPAKLQLDNGVRTITVTTLYLMSSTPNLVVTPGQSITI